MRAEGAAPHILGFCWALCLLYTSCLSFPGRSAVQRGWEQGPLVLDGPAHGLAMLAPAPGSSWGGPAQLWLAGEAASPALCWAAAQHGNGILACAEPCCETGRAELRRMGLGTSFPQRGHGVWHVLCCVAAEGDRQDGHRDLVFQRVAVQDQLSCLPQLLTGLPWGCPGSRALLCQHHALEQTSSMRMVNACPPPSHGPKKGTPGLPQPPPPCPQLSLLVQPLRHRWLSAARGVPVTSRLPGTKG